MNEILFFKICGEVRVNVVLVIDLDCVGAIIYTQKDDLKDFCILSVAKGH